VSLTLSAEGRLQDFNAILLLKVVHAEPTHTRPTNHQYVLLVKRPMLRMTMTKFLQRSGYQVTAACPDAVAIEPLVGAHRPDLIVLGVRCRPRHRAGP
jgi:hypothetical protein